MVDLEHFTISAVGFQKTTGVSVAISFNQPSANGPLWRDHTLEEFVKRLREEIVMAKLQRDGEQIQSTVSLASTHEEYKTKEGTVSVNNSVAHSADLPHRKISSHTKPKHVL